MHEGEEEAAQVDDDGVLIVDHAEVGGDGVECVEEDRYHELREGKQEDDQVSFFVEDELFLFGLYLFHCADDIIIWQKY